MVINNAGMSSTIVLSLTHIIFDNEIYRIPPIGIYPIS
mgnify:CR=1 FL=1